jgi:hypothetical protein
MKRKHYQLCRFFMRHRALRLKFLILRSVFRAKSRVGKTRIRDGKQEKEEITPREARLISIKSNLRSRGCQNLVNESQATVSGAVEAL